MIVPCMANSSLYCESGTMWLSGPNSCARMIMAIALAKSANGLFEPGWNRQHIRYVQIDVPEKLSIEGRAAFYDATGAYRDMAARGVGAVASSSAASGQPPVVGSPDRAAGAGAWPTHAAMRTCAHFS